MFENIKNNINFNIIKKAISDENGNINIKSKRYFNTLMLTYLQAKNELIYQKTGEHLLNIDDIEDAYGWSEDFCRDFFLSGNKSRDTDLCPWCLKYKDTSSLCTYGQRHGFCVKSCNILNITQTDICTYRKIIDKIDNVSLTCIPGLESLYYVYRCISELKK